MFNAPSYPRPTKRELLRYIEKQDGFFTLHYFVTKEYFRCLGSVEEISYYGEKNFRYVVKILHKSYIENGKSSFGVITYQLLSLHDAKGNVLYDEGRKTTQSMD